jgi:hypothetical protein
MIKLYCSTTEAEEELNFAMEKKENSKFLTGKHCHKLEENYP